MTTKKKIKGPDRMSESPEYLRGARRLDKCDMLPIGTCKTCSNAEFRFGVGEDMECKFGTVRGGGLPIEEDWACGDWDLKN